LKKKVGKHKKIKEFGERQIKMEEFLQQLMGKKIDVSCGSNAAFRGDVIDVKNGVLYLRDESERVAYVAIDKIALIYEVKETLSRPGFVG
jgi:hypothetical protein